MSAFTRTPALKFGRWLSFVVALVQLLGCGHVDRPAPIEDRLPHAARAAPATAAKPPNDSTAALREKLYTEYHLWKGTRYQRGGLSNRGVDCSGLAYLIYKDSLGLTLPRNSLEQAAVGRGIGRNELRAGDLVFFRTGLFEKHVGIYLEHGQFLHVSRRKGVMISTLDDAYWKRKYWQARRIRS